MSQSSTKEPKQPSVKTMERWVTVEGMSRATDGCKIEIDSEKCYHGKPNWLIKLGIL